jgi:hypothetical protein
LCRIRKARKSIKLDRKRYEKCNSNKTHQIWYHMAHGSHRIRIINHLFLWFRSELSALKPLKNLTIEHQINQTFTSIFRLLTPLLACEPTGFVGPSLRAYKTLLFSIFSLYLHTCILYFSFFFVWI